MWTRDDFLCVICQHQEGRGVTNIPGKADKVSTNFITLGSADLSGVGFVLVSSCACHIPEWETQDNADICLLPGKNLEGWSPSERSFGCVIHDVSHPLHAQEPTVSGCVMMVHKPLHVCFQQFPSVLCKVLMLVIRLTLPVVDD